MIERVQFVLQLTVPDCGGADNQAAIAHRGFNCFVFFSFGQQPLRAYCGDRFAKRLLVWSHHAQMQCAKVAHGTGGRADIEWIARTDQHHAKVFQFWGLVQSKVIVCEPVHCGTFACRPAYPSLCRSTHALGEPMEKLVSVQRIALVLSLLCLSVVSANAQEKIAGLDEIKNQADLDQAVTALDAKLFDAYNHCDLKTFDSLLADDVEFYHDQGGVTLGRQKLTESIKNNICTCDTQRVLVPGTLKIYYMQGYGAIEMGEHRLLHPKTEAANGTGEGSFVHLWR